MDESGEEIYIDISITRNDLNMLIEDLVTETINATKETMQKAGITANDVERVVFVGGPSNYKPLRDRVSSELAVRADTNVNPMTAVAEGASIFAESINWDSATHGRKSSNAEKKANSKSVPRFIANFRIQKKRLLFCKGK